MCGIIGYIGKSNKTKKILINGLKRLEYRGYDSAGLAILTKKNKKVECFKNIGQVNFLEKKIKDKNFFGKCGIAHTRWATHGGVSEKNAHPHFDCKKEFFLVHNGIIENYSLLKKQLEKEGHKFISDTDSEVLAHLIEKFYNKNLQKAVAKALSLVKGSYALVVISEKEPNKIVAAKMSSPLILGILKNSKEKGFILASDTSAIVEHTKRVIYLDDDEIVVLRPNSFKIFDLKEFRRKEKELKTINWNIEEAQKGGFAHFMLKEIFEVPVVIENAIKGRVDFKLNKIRLGGLVNLKYFLKKQVKKILIIACGSSYYVGILGKYFIEEISDISVEVFYASEFRYKNTPIDNKTLVIVISQSGETADTLAALRKSKEYGAKTMGIVNVVGSTISREVDAGIYNYAGPEIAVASTKVFISQATILYIFSLFLKDLKEEKNKTLEKELKKKIKDLKKLSSFSKKVLGLKTKIEELAKKYYKFENFLYLGRKYSYPIALEGALKLKEISYIHAEGSPAGEMKHGLIALIDKNFPSFFIMLKDEVYEKTFSNLEEIKARNGKIIALVSNGDNKIKKFADDVIYIPYISSYLNPILATIVVQLFAYYMAFYRNCPIDKPRNLAKSVTVE